MKRDKSVLAMIVLLLSVLFFSLLHRIHLHCTSYFDLGIYSDALSRISLADLNPFLPGRNIRIFNDHFDPILIPFAFFTQWFPAPMVGITTEFLALSLCWFPIRKLRDAGRISPSVAVFCYAFLLLNHATVDAVQTPFHPTTWAVLPLMYVFTFLVLGEFRGLLISLVLLFSCREEFPLIGLPITLVLFLDRKPKRALGVFILSALWILFVFVLRPRWFDGHFENYGGRLIQEAISDPIAVIKKNFTLGNARMALERTLPLFLVIDWRRIHQKWSWIFRALLVSAPILGIRFVSNQWGFHYGTAVVICALFMLLPSVNLSIAPWRNGLAILFLLATFIAQPIKIFLGSHSRCPNDTARLAAIDLAQKRLAALDGNQLLLENNLASTQFLVSKKRQTIHLLCSPTGLSMKSLDAVLIEKSGSGDPWPCSHEQLEKMMASWRANPAVRILIDDQHVFLAEGYVTVGE